MKRMIFIIFWVYFSINFVTNITFNFESRPCTSFRRTEKIPARICWLTAMASEFRKYYLQSTWFSLQYFSAQCRKVSIFWCHPARLVVEILVWFISSIISTALHHCPPSLPAHKCVIVDQGGVTTIQQTAHQGILSGRLWLPYKIGGKSRRFRKINFSHGMDFFKVFTLIWFRSLKSPLS